MAITVTVTVELSSGRPTGDASTQTLVEVRDLLTQPTDWFAASVVEQELANAGGQVVKKIAALCGDIREQHPDAPGLTTALRARPLTSPVE